MIARRRLRLLGAVAWVFAATASAPGSPPISTDGAGSVESEVRWYRLSLDERPCGRMRTERIVDADRGIRVVEETTMAVVRDGTEVRVEIALEMLESPEGNLVEVARTFRAGGAPNETRWRFGEGTVEAIRIEAGRRSTRRIDLPDDADPLSPSAARSLFAARRDAGAETAAWTTVSFEQGFEIVEVEATRLGEATFRWEDREVPVQRWRLASSGTPFPIEEWWSRDGRLVESRVATGLGRLVARLATASEAAAWRGGGLPDIVAASVVPLEGRLPQHGGDVRLRVAVGSGKAPPVLPTTPGQRFEASPAEHLEGHEGGRVAGVLTLRRRGRIFEDVAEAAPRPEHLAAGPLIETDDGEVRRLALEEAQIDPDAPPEERAERLRRFVRSWIRRKDLATAIAGAAEVARSRRGDCTEHATLLAALLRIHGVPSRIAVGLVHADRFAGRRNVFAWHAWTQGWLDGRWVDLDATAAGGGDGVRIAVAFGDLSGGAFDPVWAAALPVMGVIELSVETSVETSAEEKGPR